MSVYPKPGYWSADARNLTSLATSPDEPIATHDVSLRPGIAWPVQLVVEGGNPALGELDISVTEVDDDATRLAWLRGKNVSFMKSPNSWYSAITTEGTGGFTQCGDSGKLVVDLGGEGIAGVTTELIVEPLFDIKKIKSITSVPGTDKVAIVDEGGAKATIGKAEVTMQNGLPLLTFHTTAGPLRLLMFRSLLAA